MPTRVRSLIERWQLRQSMAAYGTTRPWRLPHQQARLLGLEAARQLEIAHKPAPLPTKVLELTQEEWTAQFSTPLRLPKPSRPTTLLKQIRAENPQALVAEKPVAELPAMTAAPTCLPCEILLDDEP
ncbi:MAG: hypothetical protein AAAC48_25825 [Phyllobacterium sp.]|uniref:hypothetical protein n=1 Tax=Phyllobacterium sp. TaxID=1871046 RepID=UPI0030F0110D